MNERLTRDELRAWLDRKPPAGSRGKPWVTWFDWWCDPIDPGYRGERSARTGPDNVQAMQKCGCEVCK